MAISFENLCDYIRDQIDSQKLNTIQLVKKVLGSPSTGLNNIAKNTFINKISEAKVLDGTDL